MLQPPPSDLPLPPDVQWCAACPDTITPGEPSITEYQETASGPPRVHRFHQGCRESVGFGYQESA